LNEAGAAVNYKLDFVQFTPAEAEELAAFVIKAADFLRRLEEILGAGLGADAPVHCRDRVAEAPITTTSAPSVHHEHKGEKP
jgi:hypothetical protein